MDTVDSYAQRLLVEGDPIEKASITHYRLDRTFPNYAKFWWQFVVPNRAENAADKLRADLPANVQKIFNTHYSALYQLTFAYGQIAYLTQNAAIEFNADLPACYVDLASPFYHLASAVDLIEQLFVAAGQLNKSDLVAPLEKKEFDKCATRWWKKYTSKAFNDLIDNSISVMFPFHTVTNVFEHILKGTATGGVFNDRKGVIRNYRNKFIHTVSPLKLKQSDTVFFPKEDLIEKFTNLHYELWSSPPIEVTSDNYEPALELMNRLAAELVQSANDLWDENLLGEMERYASVPENNVRMRTDKPENWNYPSPPKPTKPSGIKDITSPSDPF